MYLDIRGKTKQSKNLVAWSENRGKSALITKHSNFSKKKKISKNDFLFVKYIWISSLVRNNLRR